jgi:hypothetical protein
MSIYMHSRPSNLALAVIGAGIGLFLMTFVDGALLRKQRAEALARRAEMVSRLQLTDLCLTSEARYTRHPSQADLHSMFQDHPLSLEHFPSGSVFAPPPVLTTPYADLDRKTAIPD